MFIRFRVSNSNLSSFRLVRRSLSETAERKELRETVRKWAAEKIAPLATEIDKSNEFPMHLWKEMGSMGFLGVTAEEKYGGLGLGYYEHCVVMEEISRASASVGLSYGAHSNLSVNQITRNGSKEQKEKILKEINIWGACGGFSHE